MLIKLFILGRPGSGKTDAANLIYEVVKKQGWLVDFINDYDILHLRAQADTKKFELVNFYGSEGFIVLEPLIFDEVLREIEERMKRVTRPLMQEKLIIIEFARGGYREAFKCFSPKFLQGAYFLFLDVDKDICIKRIKKRVIYQAHLNRHYVPEEVFEKYYSLNDISSIGETLKKEYDADESRIKIINNNAPSLRFYKETYLFVKALLRDVQRDTEELLAFSNPTPTENVTRDRFSQETEPIRKVSLPQSVDESKAS